MRPVITFASLILLLFLIAGCREEVVEELESYGVKREWIPFAGGVAMGEVGGGMYQAYVYNAHPWFSTQLTWSPFLIEHDRKARSGKRAMRITSADSNAHLLSLSRYENLEDLLGHRIRFSAYLRPEKWEGTVAIGRSALRGVERARIDPYTGPLKDSSWNRISTEMEITPTTEFLILTLEFNGAGTILIDDCSIEKIGISSEGAAVRNVPAEHRNLGFEEDTRMRPAYSQPVDSLSYRMPSWQASYYQDEYQLLLDSTTPHSGRYCGGFRSVTTKAPNEALFYVAIPVEHLQAHRAKITLWLKPTDLTGIATLGLIANRPTDVARNVQRLWDVQGTTEWTQHTAELDVPQDAKSVWIWVGFTGQGTLLVDDLNYERLDRLPDTESFVDQASYFARPINLDFESP